MLIGVVSDTHNNLTNIETIVSLFNTEGVTLVVHTGDITNANALDKFSKLNANFIGVYGNNDRNEVGLDEVALKNKFQFQEPPKIISKCDKNIAIFHEPDLIAEFLTRNRNIHIILHGHTHRYVNEVRDGILIFNPGESAGMQKGQNAIGIVNLINLETKRMFF